MWPFNNKDKAVVRHCEVYELSGYQILVSATPGLRPGTVMTSVTAYVPTIGTVTVGIKVDADLEGAGMPSRKELKSVAQTMANVCDGLVKAKFDKHIMAVMAKQIADGANPEAVIANINSLIQAEAAKKQIIVLPCTGYSFGSIAQAGGAEAREFASKLEQRGRGAEAQTVATLAPQNPTAAPAAPSKMKIYN